jgi:hypothetical protein
MIKVIKMEQELDEDSARAYDLMQMDLLPDPTKLTNTLKVSVN